MTAQEPSSIDFINHSSISRQSARDQLSGEAPNRKRAPRTISWLGYIGAPENRDAVHVSREDLSEICRGREEAGSQTRLDYRRSAMIAGRKFLINVSPFFQSNKN